MQRLEINWRCCSRCHDQIIVIAQVTDDDGGEGEVLFIRPVSTTQNGIHLFTDVKCSVYIILQDNILKSETPSVLFTLRLIFDELAHPDEPRETL